MTAETIRIADTTTRVELEEALGNLTRHAKRQQRIVARFADDMPTAWDVAHGRIDAVLGEWLDAATCRTCGQTLGRCRAQGGCCVVCRHE